MRFLIEVSVLLFITSFSSTLADDEIDLTRDRRVIYRGITEIDFEGLEVEGQLVRPQGSLILDRKKGSFNPLIRLRTEFDEEIKTSVEMIK